MNRQPFDDDDLDMQRSVFTPEYIRTRVISERSSQELERELMVMLVMLGFHEKGWVN